MKQKHSQTWHTHDWLSDGNQTVLGTLACALAAIALACAFLWRLVG
jgi:hypothetical protein